MPNVLLILFYLLFPALVIFLSNRFQVVKKIGPVVICYAAGLLIGNINILPDNAGQYQELINTITIPLAIPLLLFPLDVKSWLRIAGNTFLSLVLGLVSVLVMVFLGYYLFLDDIPDIWKVGGLLIGVYSGGTPNLASINLALHVEPETYILTHTYDTVVGAFLLLFLITVAQRFFLLFMQPYESMSMSKLKSDTKVFVREFESYDGLFDKKVFLQLLKGLGLAILIFGIGGILSMLVPETAQMTVVILTITTLGIIASLFPAVHKIPRTFQIGMYMILVFCIVVASMADIRMFNLDSLPILYYVILAVFGSLLVHALLSVIFKIDVDNFLIVSVGLSMSPPFVPVIAGAIKNKDIIIPGLVVGIIGYAIGNYLGVFMAYILK